MKPHPMECFDEYCEGLEGEKRWERIAPFFVGYACGAARSNESIEQIIEGFKAESAKASDGDE